MSHSMEVEPQTPAANETTLIQAATSLIQADGLWLPDCGLVIQAESTVFRVSGALLAIHSPIFADMMSLPTPEKQDMFDGCPLVRLPDTASDITMFLKALLYPNFFERPPAKTTLPIVSSVLRMSSKYEVDFLKKRAVAHLSAIHPTELSSWKELDKEGDSLSADVCARRVRLVSIILLARQFSLDWILPSAFYRLAAQSESESLAIKSKMSSDDKVRWAVGCRALEGRENSKMLGFLMVPRDEEDCDQKERCFENMMTGLRDAEIRRMLTLKRRRMPLDMWREEDWESLAVCERCLEELQAVHEEARESFWDELPAIFGLPAWDVLEKMKTETLG